MNITITQADISDAAAILDLQKRAFATEADRYDDQKIAPLTESIKDMEAAFSRCLVLKAMHDNTLVGAVRGSQEGEICFPARLVVDPAVRNRGVGTRLMRRIEAAFPDARRFLIYTGFKSSENLHLYGKLGYTPFKTEVVHDRLSFVHMEKLQASPTE